MIYDSHTNFSYPTYYTCSPTILVSKTGHYVSSKIPDVKFFVTNKIEFGNEDKDYNKTLHYSPSKYFFPTSFP